MEQIIEKINELKKEKNAVLLAHYYVNPEVQAIADYVGDSYYLSELATTLPHDTIVLAGVSFMGESAKILNPEKTVLLPEQQADCPMAHMADADDIARMRAEYEDLAVVCYINSTAEIKAHSDVCVTSSNAVRIVSALPQKNIYFIPDENLGRYVAAQVPHKNVITGSGFCHVHTSIEKANVEKAKAAFPDAKILAHPECREDVLSMADYIGSTSGIIDFATQSDATAFLICTEMGVLYELEEKNPGKRFYSVGHRQFCPNMKKITLAKILHALEHGEAEVHVKEDTCNGSKQALDRMLELARID